MGNKQKQVIESGGIFFDSNEEMYFYWWAKQLLDLGYIERIDHQPESFSLSKKMVLTHVKEMKKIEDKILEHTVLHPHVYTADFKIVWTEAARNIFFIDIEDCPQTSKKHFELIKAQKNTSFIEVKPGFDQNNMTRLATINIKWVWEVKKVFVNIVVPEKLFNGSFTPDRFFMQNKTKNARKISYKNKLQLNEFLNT